MSEPYESEAEEVVDLDTCSKKKSIVIATAVVALLGFVPLSYSFLCIHFLVGGAAAAGHFAKRHAITATAGTGAKLGAVSAFLGMLINFIAMPLWLLPSMSEEEWAKIREEFIRRAYEAGNPEAADLGGKLFVSDNVTMFLAIIFALGFVLSLLLGALGGVLGASMFKKGPQAL